MSELRAQVWCTGVTRLSPDHNSIHLQAEPTEANAAWSFALPVLNLTLTATDDVAEWLRGGVTCDLTLTLTTPHVEDATADGAAE